MENINKVEDKPKTLEHELYEIKQEIVSNNYQLRLIEKQINTYKVNLKKSEIVEKEILSISDNVKLYDRIGRLFVLSDKNKISENLKKTQKDLSVDLDNQQHLFKNYEESIKEHTKHYNEVLKKSN